MTYDPSATPPPAAAPTEPKAVWALVCAIGGFFVCPLVLSIVGLVLANQSLAAIEASNGQLAGDGMAKVARILSIVGLVLMALAAVTLLAIFGIAAINA